MELIKRFFSEDEGASLVEYGLLVALIAAVCVGAVIALGQTVNTTFENIQADISGAGS